MNNKVRKHEKAVCVWIATDHTQWNNSLDASRYQNYLNLREQNHSFNMICRDIELELSHLALDLDKKQTVELVCRILRTINSSHFKNDFDQIDPEVWEQIKNM